MKSALLCLLLNFQLLYHHYTLKPADEVKGYFVAMEYKGLSNCIYRIYVTDKLIYGAKVNGYISVQNGLGIGTAIPAKQMHDPEAYVNKRLDEASRNMLLEEQNFLLLDKDNFIIHREDITKVYHNPNKKWGMGYYPHNGRIFIETIKTQQNTKAKRELILVGEQNADEILKLLTTR